MCKEGPRCARRDRATKYSTISKYGNGDVNCVHISDLDHQVTL